MYLHSHPNIKSSSWGKCSFTYFPVFHIMQFKRYTSVEPLWYMRLDSIGIHLPLRRLCRFIISASQAPTEFHPAACLELYLSSVWHISICRQRRDGDISSCLVLFRQGRRSIPSSDACSGISLTVGLKHTTPPPPQVGHLQGRRDQGPLAARLLCISSDSSQNGGQFH